jgi:hypothetical protein
MNLSVRVCTLTGADTCQQMSTRTQKYGGDITMEMKVYMNIDITLLEKQMQWLINIMPIDDNDIDMRRGIMNILDEI